VSWVAVRAGWVDDPLPGATVSGGILSAADGAARMPGGCVARPSGMLKLMTCPARDAT